MKTKEYRQKLAEQFIHILEEKSLDWKKDWDASKMVNGESGYRYKGLNAFYLKLTAANRGYEDPRWYTFNQVKNNGWKLINAKGQGVQVEYWFPYDLKEKKALQWQELKERSQKEDARIGDERYILRAVYSTVFNASLIEGAPPFLKPGPKEFEQDELVKTISSNMDVPIVHDGGGRAYYNVLEDKIHLPVPDAFHEQYAYDCTALHELSHATGAKHRLNRVLEGGFGTQKYAYEELVAEISSCFMSANIKISQDEKHIENHKAYVQSWIQSIRDKPEKLAEAVKDAEQVTAYMEYKAGLIEKAEYEQVVHSAENKEAQLQSIQKHHPDRREGYKKRIDNPRKIEIPLKL